MRRIALAAGWALAFGVASCGGSDGTTQGQDAGDASVGSGDAGDDADTGDSTTGDGASGDTGTTDAPTDDASGGDASDDGGSAGDASSDASAGNDASADASGSDGGSAEGGLDAGGGEAGSGSDAGNTGNGDAGTADAGALVSNIKHVVVIVEENHTFDTYFGNYCTAPAGSNPSCTAGPSCCEAAPSTDPSGASPVTLDDTENALYDPTHTQSCELSEMDNGAMDRYVTGASCSNSRNFAVASKQVVKTYQTWASQYALADRYFQPVAGASSSNDMYFAVAKFVFLDNAYQPKTAGNQCDVPPTTTIEYSGQTTLADLLVAAGHSFAFYAEGYSAMLKAQPLCPLPPADCPAQVPTPPCVYSGSDVPFEYYTQFADNQTYIKDYGQLANDIAAAKLPDVSFVKHVQYKNEHPGYGTTISAGVTAVAGTVSAILSSPYASDTLILLTWDEGGGFFDHVSPPPTSAVDNEPYGTRVPLLAIGPFARTNTVSHVVMEHSSVVRFIELNFLGAVGQLNARDATVGNIGSLLDPTKTGIVIP